MKRLLLTIVCLSGPALAAPVERTDLNTKLSNLICSGQTMTMANSFAAEIYDSQIEGQLLINQNGAAAKIEDAKRKAKSIAKANGYLGYAYGICISGVGFAAGVPAPVGIDTNFKKNLGALKKNCASWRADFAPANKGLPSAIELQDGKLALPESDGIASLNCQPLRPRWRGPIQWYLFPVGKGLGPTPELATLKAKAKEDERLALWINALRKMHGLATTIVTDDMHRSADRLGIGSRIAHDRSMLTQEAKQLQTSGMHLIGENRVKGGSVEQLAHLLWNSPRHRELLLNKNATHMGIKVNAMGPDVFAVMVMGETLRTYSQRKKAKTTL